MFIAGIVHRATGMGEPSERWYGQQAVYRVSMGNFVGYMPPFDHHHLKWLPKPLLTMWLSVCPSVAVACSKPMASCFISLAEFSGMSFCELYNDPCGRIKPPAFHWSRALIADRLDMMKG